MWANERAEATLFDLLTLICFILPPAIGLKVALIEGKAAGPVGILIGILVGLGAGGLAAYTLRLTYRLDEKHQIAKLIFETDLFFIFIAVVIGAAVGLTKIITMNIVPHVAF